MISALPWDIGADDLAAVAPALHGKIVVSCANPIVVDVLGPRALDVGQDSAAERLAALLPESVVVGAFQPPVCRQVARP